MKKNDLLKLLPQEKGSKSEKISKMIKIILAMEKKKFT